MEEENAKPTDFNSCPDPDSNQDNSTKDSDNNEAIMDVRNRLYEMYKLHVFYMDLINQTPKRKVNCAMYLTQLFGRYSNKQIIIFLSAALALVVIQILCMVLGASSRLILLLSALTAAVTLVFTCITLNGVWSAVKEIRLLKKGYCCIGYPIISEDLEKDLDNSNPKKITIAYKDSFNMIRALEISVKKNGKFIPSVFLIFMDFDNPYEVALFDFMPLEISYERNQQTFTQKWKGTLYTLVPAAMAILYAISFYLGYIAYTTLHQ